jgi:hypothetical protein
MKYPKNNFNHNFSNFIQSGDMEITKDLIINEIHSIVQKDKAVIVSLLTASKVQATVKESNKSIWDKIFKNIANPLVRDGIADLIVKNNQRKSGADGVTTATTPVVKAPTDWAALGSKGLDALKSALDLFKGETPPAIPATTDNYAVPQKSNTLLYVGIGVAVLAISYYVYTKTRNKI